MELKEVERRCCVVTVSEAPSGKAAASCSGVLLHPGTGTLICSGLPFSRFVAGGEPLSPDHRFLPARSFSGRLRIRVAFSSGRGAEPSHREAAGELLMLVNCPEFGQAFRAVFQESDRWRFHGEEREEVAASAEDEELLRDAQFLSWFAVVRAAGVATDGSPDPGPIAWQSGSALQKGDPVVACGSPFGSLCLDLFISTVSRGIVSNLAGEGNAVILTDARCLPGTEGGGVFAAGGAGRLRLVGLIVSPFGWKASEWIGLTLVCAAQPILRSLLHCAGARGRLRDVWPRPGDAGLQVAAAAQAPSAAGRPAVCFVDSGQFWGSGVAVSPQLVVTCRHVVDRKSTVSLKFHHRERVRDVAGDVIFSTKRSSPYDVAVVQLRDPLPGVAAPRMAQEFSPGECVLVVGYGGLGGACGPSLTAGILSRAVSLNGRPVMLQTTCAVQAGASGGAVVRARTGELLGIVSSNIRDFTAKVTYPHLNFSIPVTVLQRLLARFSRTGDAGVFGALDSAEEEVRRVWRLQDAQSKL